MPAPGGSGEVRGATWSEIDLGQDIWKVLGERMKAGKEHRVPLSDAALAVLCALPRMAGTDLVFPAPRGGVMSDMTLVAVTRRMGAAAVPHGFRPTFRDWAAECTNYREPTAASEVRTGLGVASFARWLTAFIAVSGDTFFEFDYGEVHRHFGIDEFLLGFEAARHHGDALIDDELDAGDTEHLRRCALKELLSSGDYFDPHLVRSFFGSSATLFFSLYNSIWPKLSLPAGDAFDELLGLRRASYVDIDHAWQFVDQDDWTHIDAGADVR